MNSATKEPDGIGKAKALADSIDAKYRKPDAIEYSLGLTYEFLNDIKKLNDTVSGLAKGRDKDPAVNELEKRLDGWNACVGQLYLQAHQNGIYRGHKDTTRSSNVHHV